MNRDITRSVLYSFRSCDLNEIPIQEGPEEIRLHLQQTATRQARIVIVILEVDHRRRGRHEWSFADERAGQLFAWIWTQFVVWSCRSSGWRTLRHQLVFQVDGQRDRQTLRQRRGHVTGFQQIVLCDFMKITMLPWKRYLSFYLYLCPWLTLDLQTLVVSLVVPFLEKEASIRRDLDD